jgi:hypothetical protein
MVQVLGIVRGYEVDAYSVNRWTINLTMSTSFFYVPQNVVVFLKAKAEAAVTDFEREAFSTVADLMLGHVSSAGREKTSTKSQTLPPPVDTKGVGDFVFFPTVESEVQTDPVPEPPKPVTTCTECQTDLTGDVISVDAKPILSVDEYRKRKHRTSSGTADAAKEAKPEMKLKPKLGLFSEDEDATKSRVTKPDVKDGRPKDNKVQHGQSSRDPRRKIPREPVDPRPVWRRDILEKEFESSPEAVPADPRMLVLPGGSGLRMVSFDNALALDASNNLPSTNITNSWARVHVLLSWICLDQWAMFRLVLQFLFTFQYPDHLTMFSSLSVFIFTVFLKVQNNYINSLCSDHYTTFTSVYDLHVTISLNS